MITATYTDTDTATDVGTPMIMFLVNMVLLVLVVWLIISHHMDVKRDQHMATISARKARTRAVAIDRTSTVRVFYLFAPNNLRVVESDTFIRAMPDANPARLRYTKYHHIVLPDGRFIGRNDQKYLVAVKDEHEALPLHLMDNRLFHGNEYVFVNHDGYMGLWASETVPENEQFLFRAAINDGNNNSS